MKTLLRICGMALCVLPPALATLEHLPLWFKDGKSTLSFLSLSLLCLSALPLFRLLRRHTTPSAWMLWLAVFLILRAVSPILDAISRIALIAFPTNLLGAILLRLGGGRKKQKIEQNN